MSLAKAPQAQKFLGLLQQAAGMLNEHELCPALVQLQWPEKEQRLERGELVLLSASQQHEVAEESYVELVGVAAYPPRAE